MNKTTYHVERMDCGAEEQMIRVHLAGGLIFLIVANGARRILALSR